MLGTCATHNCGIKLMSCQKCSYLKESESRGGCRLCCSNKEFRNHNHDNGGFRFSLIRPILCEFCCIIILTPDPKLVAIRNIASCCVERKGARQTLSLLLKLQLGRDSLLLLKFHLLKRITWPYLSSRSKRVQLHFVPGRRVKRFGGQP